jgi:hypothetical protein
MFTFKTVKPTGRYKWLQPDSHYIKINRKQVGSIDPDNPFRIRLLVLKDDIMEDGNPNCPWKSICLKKESTSLQEAKKFLNDHFTSLTAKYKIYQLED